VAWLGGHPESGDAVWQDIYLPCDRQATLSFYHRHEEKLTHGTSEPYIDRLLVRAWDPIQASWATIATLTNENLAPGFREWVRETVALPSWVCGPTGIHFYYLAAEGGPLAHDSTHFAVDLVLVQVE
jgi:hypothetical protein